MNIISYSAGKQSRRNRRRRGETRERRKRTRERREKREGRQGREGRKEKQVGEGITEDTKESGKKKKKLRSFLKPTFPGITLYWHAMRTERARKTQLLMQANTTFESSGLYSSPQNPTIIRNLTVW
jgi:hypothetical protein